MSGYPYNQRHYRRFRNILIDLNRDLLTISEYMNEYDDYYELNDLCYFVMALEDRRFFRHCGFDFFSFVREVFKAACKKKHGGASTIDMQLVRTITGFKDLTLYRKFYEVILAILLNFKFSKKQIIMCYLRNAFFGSRLIGSEKAASFLIKR
ncbi:transglycosylase domain-containing protein [Raoultella ornithinolytica]|uniref:transglycosylase domain-containing protein n=1 Tax=Raoultella ornithinolytica TaxID=54291 RepID=UPI001F25D79B|nr:transglycosylase domain-containing protein [Raoultella ornithinolytica]UIZ74182.1 transglycosylase domain-containing protein [Raoultella ornithinolytica]